MQLPGAPSRGAGRGSSEPDGRYVNLRGWAGALGAVVALALGAGPARAQWVSPGPLARSHSDLDREDRCERCHTRGAGVQESRCLSCHGKVGKRLRAGKGFHTQLARSSGKPCAGCHSDHRGRKYPLIRWSPPSGFSHAKETGFDLTGAHAALGCGRCHKQRPRYMLASTACRGCHTDPHRSELGKACEKCHTTKAFRPASAFDHAKTKFPLEGRHKGVGCTACHPGTVGGAGTFRRKRFERCSSCHTDPHRGRTALSPCTTCHTPTGWHETRRSVPPAHSPAGYPLVGKHANVPCRDCHGSKLTAKVSRACGGCHQDAHDGRLGTSCSKCHSEAGWKGASSRFDHGATRFPLRGRHQKVTCAKCHRPAAAKKAVYRGIAFGKCTDCHKDVHQGRFGAACTKCHSENGWKASSAISKVFDHSVTRYPLRGRHRRVACRQCHKGARTGKGYKGLRFDTCSRCHGVWHPESFVTVPRRTACEACHAVEGFDPSSFTVAQHARSRWPLEGSHQAVLCSRCHKRVAPGPTPLAFPSRACAGCHADPHKGQFADRMAQGSCGACHSQAGWSMRRFDHSRTAFPLEGVHAEAACASCHTGQPTVKYKGLPSACAACHADPHLGQFATEPARACTACHRASGWKIAKFDHAAQAGWALSGKHAPVRCDQCHPRVALDGVGATVRYRLGKQECQDCHKNPHTRRKP